MLFARIDWQGMWYERRGMIGRQIEPISYLQCVGKIALFWLYPRWAVRPLCLRSNDIMY